MAKKINEKELFNTIVENAVDFLRRSVEELETLPKYSVIHFWSAIELFFKARLLKEHWTLLFAEVDNANLDKIISGEFVSVSYGITLKRLSNSTGRSVQQQALDSFEILRKRRNRLIHFFHKEYTDPIDKNTLNAIVAEQCRGWFYLHNLLSKEWVKEFSSYQSKISDLHEKLKEQRGYLQTKYEGLENAITQGINRGVKFRHCFSCTFLAQKIVEEKPFYRFQCLVCEANGAEVHIDCPKCNSQLEIEDGEGNCSNCGKYIDTQELIDLHNPEPERIHHDDPFRLDIACDECNQLNTVVTLHDTENEFGCLACANIYQEFQLEECRKCSSLVATLSNDIVFGCLNCEFS